jgi:hypothetical protein
MSSFRAFSAFEWRVVCIPRLAPGLAECRRYAASQFIERPMSAKPFVRVQNPLRNDEQQGKHSCLLPYTL